MIQQTSFKRRYTCGQHVTGHGRHISTRGEALSADGQASSSGKERLIEKGVITGLPRNHDEPYTVLDEQTFITLEAQEEHLRPLS